MAKYAVDLKFRAAAEAASTGLKPTARKFGVTRNTLRRWMRDCRFRVPAPDQRVIPRKPTADAVEFIVRRKEAMPAITLIKLKKILKQDRGEDLSLQGIGGIIARFGMAKGSCRPFQYRETAMIRSRAEFAEKLLGLGKSRAAAAILNGLPALSDPGILKKIPAGLLSLRRQAERLSALWNTSSLRNLERVARRLRLACEKRKRYLTAAFVASYEMNALNFRGQPLRVVSLYRRYRKFLPGLPTALKYLIRAEYFTARCYLDNRPARSSKVFAAELEKFVLRNQDRLDKLEWFDALSSCFNLQENYRKQCFWTKRLMETVPDDQKDDYRADYLTLLSFRGNYQEILGQRGLLGKITSVPFLRASLAVSTAWLGRGDPDSALETALRAFAAAEKENLLPAMSGFTLFLACCYAALNDEASKKKYLNLYRHFSRDLVKYRELGRLLTEDAPPKPGPLSPMLRLAYQYRQACRTLKHADYLRVLRAAEKHGLTGFLHRMILIRPQAVVNLIRRGRDPRLPRDLLNVPAFKSERPGYRLQLLAPRETLTYGGRKIKLSPGSKDFHLLVYLLLHRNQVLSRERVADTFYRAARNPALSMTKALSRIRNALFLTRKNLRLRSGELMFRIDASVDLEDFEKRYWAGKTLEKVGETDFALQEYRECLNVYHAAPFSKMGFYYHFAEEKRTTALRMLEDIAGSVLAEAKKNEDWKAVRNIESKLKREAIAAGDLKA